MIWLFARDRAISLYIVAISILFGVLASPRAAVAGVIWTESFDNGVGRFDQTIGPGAERFFPADSPLLRAHFIRDGANDRRYAPLGETLDANNQVLGFSFRIFPLAGTVGGGSETSIGFWNSGSDNATNRLGINFTVLPNFGGSIVQISGNYADGSSFAQSTSVDVPYLRNYFVDVIVNGPEHEVAADIYLLPDDSGLPPVPPPSGWLGTLLLELDPGRELMFDSLGFGGGFGNGEEVRTFIDDVSYTVPEPATALFLSLGGLLAIRRRAGR